jgi:DNA-binding PadR family transcriptional regulator
MNQLTRNEEIVLLSVLRMEGDAYGVLIKRQIRDLTRGDWNYGLLYSTLDQLVKKGLLLKREGKPMPERGGRRKIYYSLSRSGKMALEQAYALKEALWDGITPPEFKKGESPS